MQTFRNVFLTLLATFAFSNSYAIDTHYVENIFHIDDAGVILNVNTGLVVTKEQAAESIPTGGPLAVPVVIGIIIGSVGSATLTLVQGGDAKQILLSGFFGGVAGYYGVMATISGAFGAIVYGSGAVGATVVGGTATGQVTVAQISQPVLLPIDPYAYDGL